MELNALQHKLKLMQRTHQESVDSFKKSLADIQLSYDAKQEHNKKVAEVEKLSETSTSWPSTTTRS